MSECKRCRRLFKEALYDELDSAQRGFFDKHIKECARCRSSFQQLEATVNSLDKSSRDVPDPDFWDGYWDRLLTRMEEEKVVPLKDRSARRPLIHIPRWAWQAAAAAGLVTVGILIGRAFFNPASRTVLPGGSTSAVVKTEPGFELVQRTRNYVRRSQMMLLAIVNFDPETEDPFSLDLDNRQRMSRELVQEAALLKQELDDRPSRRLRELIADLDMILLQIANLEDPSLVDLEMIRTGVESRGILFKIHLVNSNPELSKWISAAPAKDKPRTF